MRLFYFLPALLWALLIWSLSTADPASLPQISFFSADKIGHLVFYSVLTFLLIWALQKGQKLPSVLGWRGLVWAAGLASAYGAGLEFVQARLPFRSFDYADMLANCAGALLACVAYRFWRRS